MNPDPVTELKNATSALQRAAATAPRSATVSSLSALDAETLALKWKKRSDELYARANKWEDEHPHHGDEGTRGEAGAFAECARDLRSLMGLSHPSIASPSSPNAPHVPEPTARTEPLATSAEPSRCPATSGTSADWMGQLTPAEHSEFGDIYLEAIEIVRRTRQASSSTIQRRLRIGYNRAARMLTAMERMGLIGPERDYQPREILGL